MHHQVFGSHLGRRTNQAKALYRSQVRSVLERGKIETTSAKAVAIRGELEKLISLAKKDSVHNRRQAVKILGGNGNVDSLFERVGPAFSDVSSGFTRMIKLGPRFSDTSEMVILELTRLPQPGTGGQARVPVETGVSGIKKRVSREEKEKTSPTVRAAKKKVNKKSLAKKIYKSKNT